MSLARNIVRRQLQQADLPHTIQDIANGVLRDPLIHLPSLILLFTTQPSQAMQYPQLLTLFFHQFEGTPPLNRLTEADEIRVRVARMALDGITVVQHADYESETAKSVLGRYMSSAWPSIWKWMHFLYYETGNGQLDTTFDAGSRPTIERLPIMNQIQGLLSVIIHNRSPALISAVLASHDMLKMVTEIWVRHCERPPSDPMFRYSSLLSTTLSTILNSTPADLPDLEEGFGVGPLELARLLLKPLRSIRIVQGGQARFISEHDPYISVYLTFREKHHDIFLMLLANGILNDILYALSVLLCLPPPIPPKTRACITTCFNFVFMATASHVDYKWVIDAVHLKLVHSLLKQAISLTNGLYISDGTANDEPYYFRHIIHIFERFVIHRPVLKLFEKVVRSESVLLLWSKVPAGSLFRTQWSTFLDYLNSLVNVKASFDQSEDSKMKCSLFKCINVESTERFRECGRCQQVVYCSSSCQREDWEDGYHRQDCEASCKSQSGAVHVSLRDRAFFAFLVDERMKSDYKQIIEYRDKALSSLVAPSTLKLTLNYTRYPTTLEVCPRPINATVYPLADDPGPDLSIDRPYFAQHKFIPAVNGREALSTTTIPLSMSQFGEAKRRALIEPYLLISHANDQIGMIYTPWKVSGDLFGWIED